MKRSEEDQILIDFYRKAIRGGNAINDTATLIEFLSNRLINVYGENPNMDFHHAARERASLLRTAMKMVD